VRRSWLIGRGWLFLLGSGWLFPSCTCGSPLRGDAESSSDGRTYLLIQDDNGGLCGSILVDGEIWPHEIGVMGVIEPGLHTLGCGSLADPGEVEVVVPEGVVFSFDYWGP